MDVRLPLFRRMYEDRDKLKRREQEQMMEIVKLEREKARMKENSFKEKVIVGVTCVGAAVLGTAATGAAVVAATGAGTAAAAGGVAVASRAILPAVGAFVTRIFLR